MSIRGNNSSGQTFFLTFSVSKASLIVEGSGCQRLSSVFALWKGDGCMKDTDHPIRHPRVHLGDRASAQRNESYARQNAQDGRGMAACWAGATPLFATYAWPKDHRGRSSPTNRTSGQNLSWTDRGSSDAVFSRRTERTSSFLLVFLNNRGRCEERFTPVLHGDFNNHFTGRGAMVRQINPMHAPKRTELHADRHDGRAGATPPFDARCVTGFVRSLPPSQELRVNGLRGCMHRTENLSDKRSDNLYQNERRSPLSILKSPPKQPKAVTIQARVEESVKTQLELYAEFIDASPSYVITEALKLLFRKDDDFRRWTDHHTNNHNNEKARGEVLAKAV
jgi:hypothetical protein